MVDKIPGAENLGQGFDIFGTFDTTSLKLPLLDLGALNGEYSYPLTKTTYAVPDNCIVDGDTGSHTRSEVFETRRSFQEYFSGSVNADVKVGSGATFSGQFDASISQTYQDDTEYSYALKDVQFAAWQLRLRTASANDLHTDVLDDPVYRQLPDTFEPDSRNLDKFTPFFRKYGTHYTSQVVTGGRMLYLMAAAKSYLKSKIEFQAKVDLEYDAIFEKASGSAQAEWKQISEAWVEHRWATVQTVGGESKGLDGADPSYGESLHEAFLTWREGVETNPNSVWFKLEPVSSLFSGAQANAIDQAIVAYANATLRVTSSEDAFVTLNGRQLDFTDPNPSHSHDMGPFGFKIAVIDRNTLKVLLANRYHAFFPEYSYGGYPEAYADLKKYQGDRDVIIAFTTYSMCNYYYPPADFREFMKTFGASDGLGAWGKDHDDSSYMHACYVLAGIPGLNAGFEVSNIVDTYRHPQGRSELLLYLVPKTSGGYELIKG